MSRIVVSQRACEMLQRKTHKDFRGVIRRLADGSLEVEIASPLHGELKNAQFPGETLSACILRYLPIRARGRR